MILQKNTKYEEEVSLNQVLTKSKPNPEEPAEWKEQGLNHQHVFPVHYQIKYPVLINWPQEEVQVTGVITRNLLTMHVGFHLKGLIKFKSVLPQHSYMRIVCHVK